MDARSYERMSARERMHDGGARLRAVDRLCVIAVAGAYLVLIAWLAWECDSWLMPALLGPATGFLALSALRRTLNRPRPYEILDIEPLLDAHETGKSFPSRHVFSGAVIAVSIAPAAPIAGTIIVLSSILLAAIRVVGGVHWPRDVVAGFVAGALWGLAACAIAFAC